MTDAAVSGAPRTRVRLTETGRVVGFLGLGALGLPWLAGADALDGVRIALPLLLLLVGCGWLGRGNLRGITIAMPAPVTDFEFAATVAGLQLQRHGRRMAHDLLLRHGEGVQRRPILYLATLASGDLHAARVPLRLPSRGRSDHHDVVLHSSWPLGLVRWEASHRLDCEILALPRLGELRNAETLLPHGGARRASDPRLLGEAEEFHALRAWRPGMPQRRIHWKSSARSGRLMVRETRSARKPDVVVLLAPPAPRGGSGTGAATTHAQARLERRDWETSIRLAATLVEWFLREEHPVHLVWSGEQPFRMRLPAGREGLFRALGAVAQLPRTPQATEVREPPPRVGSLLLLVAAGGGHRTGGAVVRLDPAAAGTRALYRAERRIAPRARMEVPA